jgi:hypothetical protein
MLCHHAAAPAAPGLTGQNQHALIVELAVLLRVNANGRAVQAALWRRNVRV